MLPGWPLPSPVARARVLPAALEGHGTAGGETSMELDPALGGGYSASMTRLTAGALFVTAATWAALVARIASDPANHVGAEPLLAMVPFSILLLLAWLGPQPQQRGVRIVLTVYALVSLAAVVSIDRTNVLVQYDRWTSRGMPERPCDGIARYVMACKP